MGFNQTIRVNSTADECFQHGIGRTVDDLVQAMQDVLDLESVKTKLEGLQENATGGDADILNKQMEAVEKALTLSKDKCQKLFESSITTFQGYLDDANLCITNCGTRSSKLELIENRMKSQKTVGRYVLWSICAVLHDNIRRLSFPFSTVQPAEKLQITAYR